MIWPNPKPPSRDLWPAIAARLERSDEHADASAPAAIVHTLTPPVRRSRLLPWAMAASVAAVSVLAIGLAQRNAGVSAGSVAATPALAKAWQPKDPRLSGAAVELQAARLELAQAMQQAPDSPYLHRLMHRTEKQQMRLRRLENEAG